MPKYMVKGTFKMGYNYAQAFNKEVSAASEKQAVSKLYSIFGGNYKCKRQFINILGVALVKE